MIKYKYLKKFIKSKLKINFFYNCYNLIQIYKNLIK